MNITETISVTITSGLISGFVSYYFAQKTENYKFAQLQKQKAEVVVMLFAKWIKYKGEEKNLLSKEELIEYYEELNRMSFELSFWIKDHKLLTDIMLRLQNHETARDTREIIGGIRKLILEDSKDKFDHRQITLWPKD